MKIKQCTIHWERPSNGKNCDKINDELICCKDCSQVKTCNSICNGIYIDGGCVYIKEVRELPLASKANPILDKAIRLAMEYHKDQTDKAGAQYILHLIAVMESKHCIDDEDRVVAILHDIIEDTEMTAGKLLEEGIPSHLVETIQLLTKDSRTDYMLYIRNLKKSGNARAIRVKMADLEHNGDLTRIPQPNERDIERAKRYDEALKYLRY